MISSLLVKIVVRRYHVYKVPYYGSHKFVGHFIVIHKRGNEHDRHAWQSTKMKNQELLDIYMCTMQDYNKRLRSYLFNFGTGVLKN